jgi:hypothetical protein
VRLRTASRLVQLLIDSVLLDRGRLVGRAWFRSTGVQPPEPSIGSLATPQAMPTDTNSISSKRQCGLHAAGLMDRLGRCFCTHHAVDIAFVIRVAGDSRLDSYVSVT